MNRQTLDVDHGQTVAGAQAMDRGQREVAQVLVIDGVELSMVDEVPHVGHLDNRDAVRRQQRREAPGETRQVRHVGEDVVGVDHVGAIPARRQRARARLPEKVDDRRNPPLFGDLRNVGGRFDTEHSDARATIELQEVTVVTGDLRHERITGQLTIANDTLDKRLGMPEHRVAERRKVRVVGKEA